MDWFSWLSKTNLDPTLVYDYGVTFAQNELQAEDLIYFDHEFLQSMGIMIAKHRLEILKLARKEVGSGPLGLSRLIFSINKSKKSLKKCINKLVSRRDLKIKALPRPESYGWQWNSEALTRKYGEKEFKLEKPPVLAMRSQAKSGPLDRNKQENWMANNKSLKLSGPLDGKAQDNLVWAYKSPRFPGTPDLRVKQRRLVVTSKSPQLTTRPMVERPASPSFYGDYNKDRARASELDDHSLWTSLFQDMRPT